MLNNLRFVFWGKFSHIQNIHAHVWRDSDQQKVALSIRVWAVKGRQNPSVTESISARCCSFFRVLVLIWACANGSHTAWIQSMKKLQKGVSEQQEGWFDPQCLKPAHSLTHCRTKTSFLSLSVCVSTKTTVFKNRYLTDLSDKSHVL